MDGIGRREGREVVARRWGIDPTLDLRRKGRREERAWIAERAKGLLEPDRSLLCHVYGRGMTIAEVAASLGECPRAMRARVRRLVRRVCSARFSMVVTRSAQWSPERRAIAEACVLRGMSFRAASESLGLSLYVVREHMHAIDALCAEAQPREGAGEEPASTDGTRGHAA